MSARTRIKFCGMTRAGDIAAAVALGVDAIGLIFAERSPRRVDLASARALRAAVPPFVSVVALLMDTPPTEVERVVQVLRPQLLQFHGAEEEADCARFGVPYLRAVPMGDAASGDAHATARALEFVARYPSASGFILDGHAHGAAGGSGTRFDWSQIPASMPRPWLLAGGLDADNVAAAIAAARPFGVDVSSGIERAPGEKDPARMQRFVAEVRRVDGTTTQR